MSDETIGWFEISLLAFLIIGFIAPLEIVIVVLAIVVVVYIGYFIIVTMTDT
jgi:hypothetical protein